MSATLQIIAVMKTPGAITLKDHSIVSVNQGTMEMDKIVQVKIIYMPLVNESTFKF